MGAGPDRLGRVDPWSAGGTQGFVSGVALRRAAGAEDQEDPRGLVASAGVHYGKPTGHQKPPVTVDLAGDATALDLHRLIAAASGAAAARLDGSDSGHGEHRLQSMLTARDLGLVHMVRELAIRRPGRRPRYVDFVGVDQRGDIHVVETKIGNDEMLVLQGLDYWIWAQTHLDTWPGTSV